MKRYFVIIIFNLLLFSSCKAQKLEGAYCHSFNSGYDVSCLTFKENNRFTYKTSGDLGTYITGKGNYSLMRNTLKLDFDKDSLIQKSEVTIKDLSHKDKRETDSIDLIFKIYDGHNNEIPFPGAFIHNVSEDISVSKQNSSNRDGHATISQPKNSRTETFKVGSIFYEKIDITVKNDATKEIEVILYPEQPNKISDTTFIYYIKKIDKKSFLTTDDHFYKKAE